MDASPRDIGSRLELFVDEWLIDEMDGVALKMHKPVPREVVMEYDRPWEGPVSMPGGVMVDDGKFKTWYAARSSGGASGQSQDSHTAYAESEDGIHWERPALGPHGDPRVARQQRHTIRRHGRHPHGGRLHR